MLKDIINQNAKKAKQQLQQEIESQKAYIKLKEETFYNSLISNPTNYSIREQATFLGSCRTTLNELELALFILEGEFPTRNHAREFDLYGEMAREFNETYPATEEEWMDIDEGGL
jgi:hypothetical protein